MRTELNAMIPPPENIFTHFTHHYNPYTHSKEPYTHSKEPYSHFKEPYAHSKSPIHAQTSSNESYILKITL
jgi:hypothetical protein